MRAHAPESVSPALARRIQLAAQGFGGGPVAGGVGASAGTRQLISTVARLGLLQLDSVNVFERSHYLPLFARVGAYDRALADRALFPPRGRYVEYWAHEAALVPVATWPLLRWRMDRYREKSVGNPSSWASANGAMLDFLRRELAERGPRTASAFEHPSPRRRGPWWDWSDVKTGLEVLFRWGEVVSAGRTRFERVYALPEQVLPAEIIDARPERIEAQRMLVRHAARALGIGTAADFADYFRMRNDETLVAIRALSEEGELVPVTVPGWPRDAWLHRDARLPRRVEATALLSPFDPVVWDRRRAERMFGFHYRIEIYTPAPKRVFGYYSLPILLDDRLVGRIDLKSDRQNGVLRVQSAWSEPGTAGVPEVAERLAPLLRETAAWQGLGDIEVVDRGTLAARVAAELGVGLRAAADPETRVAAAASEPDVIA